MCDTCDICTEKYNKVSRKPIKCQYCEFIACADCTKKYILNETTIHCMNNDCKREWTRHYISTKFSLNFVNTVLKKHREKILFDRERALLPATQPMVEEIIRKENITIQLRDTMNKITELRGQYAQLRRDLYNNVRQARAVFIRACPDENCRGFLSNQWKCGLCSKWTCPTCHVIKGEDRNVEHICNENDVATANLLNSDTKPCPKCGEGIFKIDGCDQIWCTQCHTAFNWRTGAIENTHIHNPHYFEWQRRNNTIERNPDEIQCGREMDHHMIDKIHKILYRKSVLIDDDDNVVTDEEQKIKITVLSKYMCKICRNVMHIRIVDLERYRYNYEDNNINLRIQYMRKFLNEDQFKTLLQQQDKRNEKTKEIRDILQMVVATSTDIIYRFHDEIKKREWKYSDDINSYVVEIEKIIAYSNECLAIISQTYSSVRCIIDDTMVLR